MAQATVTQFESKATTREAFARSPALISPVVDLLMIGGASLLLFTFAYLLIDKSANTNQISWAAFYLAFVVNNPHFMASYLLLYWDKRRELLKNRRFLWAGVVAPILVIAYMAATIAFQSPLWLSYAVNFMFFTVGWHYVKQIYGTIVVTSARRGYFFSKRESQILKANLFPVWFMSYISGNTGMRELFHYGIGYKTFDLPAWALTANYVLLGISLLAVGYVLFMKWIREGKLPGLPAALSFAAIYVWYLPPLYHAPFWYMIPFFHSLQYMLFVAALKKNQYAAEAKTYASEPAKQRLYFARRLFGFGAAIIALALVTFKWLPEGLDAAPMYNKALFGSQLWMFLFITFINIHHYFIDNVIWRRDNLALKQYLL